MKRKRKVRGDEESEHRLLWEKAWKEREDFLRAIFGPTNPPNWVTSYYWDDPTRMVPGGCALTFPPLPSQRPHWLYLTHGLTQPLKLEHAKPAEASGHGWEFAILTHEKEEWPLDALYHIMTYCQQGTRKVEMGDFMPFPFPSQGVDTSDSKWGFLYWLYLTSPDRFCTSTGYFWIMTATSITKEERELARTTSPVHLALLLCWANVGQVSDLSRRSVLADSATMELWNRIASLSIEAAQKELQALENGARS